MSGRFPTFKLTDKQIKGIANIVLHEQGTIAGWYAEASQIANLAELKYSGDIVKCVTSGWYAHGKERYKAGTSNATVIKIVKRVLCEGFRTLPRYVDEHDCMPDISTVKNGSTNVKGTKSKWKMHETVIKNRMGSTYIFYCFPGGDLTGVDPFGYKSKANREKYGDFCYSVAEAQAGMSTEEQILKLLGEYNTYIKAHYKKFVNNYDGSITTFAKAKSLISAGKNVGITCVVPLRWALAELGIKNSGGKSLISAPGGSFETYYAGDVAKLFTRITSGGAVGKTIIQAIDAGTLKAGDIVCYKGLTHTSVYSGQGYKFYEGGGACAKDHYQGGILSDYSKNGYKDRKIAEILRIKEAETKKEEYNMPVIKKGSKRLAVRVWQAIVGETVDGIFGEKTDAATRAFQKKHGLTVDGIVGKYTWGAGIETL